MGKHLAESVFQFVDMPEKFDATSDCALIWSATLQKFTFVPIALLPLLTDNSAGTADNTVQAMPSPADAPATADALRDDLVANFIPAVRNNIADLTAKVNALITGFTT